MAAGTARPTATGRATGPVVDAGVSAATSAPLGAALSTHDRLAALVRDEYGRVLSVLARDLRDLDLAEDALSEAITAGLEQWPETGPPRQPAAWLLTVARRRAVDRLRREATARRKARLLVVPDADAAPVTSHDDIGDERLRLLYTACHPALSTASQVALTLRVVGGLDTGAIARAFLVTEATMAQRISRAKRKIRAAGIPFAVPEPAARVERRASVQAVIYLIFTEGHLPVASPTLQRPDLQQEAIRLARLLLHLDPHAETRGLLALLLLTAARSPARVRDGRPVPLPRQDRTLWRSDLIAEGTRLVASAFAGGTVGGYTILAAIAAAHADARCYAATDWVRIVALYDLLLAHGENPVMALNQAVARMEGGDLDGAHRQMRAHAEALAGHSHFHAAMGELLLRLHRPATAADAFDAALSLTTNAAVADHLRARRAEANHRAGHD